MEKKYDNSQFNVLFNHTNYLVFFIDISSVEHLACMRVVQQRIILQVFTINSDATQFENMLLTTAYGAAHLLMLEHCDMKCLIFKSANLPLFGAHMLFNCLGPKSLEIEAFTKYLYFFNFHFYLSLI